MTGAARPEIAALNSATDLAYWTKIELQGQNDTNFIMRTLAHETERWCAAQPTEAEFSKLTSFPARIGTPKWDAFLEGIVAYRANLLGFERPQWTTQTRLEVGWNPYNTLNLIDTFDTPAAFLEKGITYSRRNMDLL